MTHQKTDWLASDLAAGDPSHNLSQIGAKAVEENEQEAVVAFGLCQNANF